MNKTLCQNKTENSTLKILGFRKEDRKRNKQFITIGTPEFEKLSTGLLWDIFWDDFFAIFSGYLVIIWMIFMGDVFDALT